MWKCVKSYFCVRSVLVHTAGGYTDNTAAFIYWSSVQWPVNLGVLIQQLVQANKETPKLRIAVHLGAGSIGGLCPSPVKWPVYSPHRKIPPFKGPVILKTFRCPVSHSCPGCTLTKDAKEANWDDGNDTEDEEDTDYILHTLLAKQVSGMGPREWASDQIRKITGCACAANAGNVFPATDFKGNH